MDNLRQLLLEEDELPIFVCRVNEVELEQKGYFPIDTDNVEIKELTYFDDEWLDREQYEDKLREEMFFDDIDPELELDELVAGEIKEQEFKKVLVIYESEDDVVDKVYSNVKYIPTSK